MSTDEEKLVVDNMKLAYNIAWQYNKKMQGIIPLDELQSLAFLGLTKAAKTFNSDLGYAFSTYAYQTMKNEILMFHRNNNKHIINSVSLFEKVNDDFELQDTLASDFNMYEDIENSLSLDKLHKEIATLNERHKQIINYRLQGLTLCEIADILGVSQPQVSRDLQKALNILRYRFKDWG